MGAVYLIVALLSTAIAQVLYKLYAGRSGRVNHLTLALALFALAQGGFFLSLTQLEVGLVYMSTGLTHLMVMVLSGRVLGETITRHHWVAASMIVSGLVLYSW